MTKQLISSRARGLSGGKFYNARSIKGKPIDEIRGLLHQTPECVVSSSQPAANCFSTDIGLVITEN